MSFSDQEVAYLRYQRLARLATVAPGPAASPSAPGATRE